MRIWQTTLSAVRDSLHPLPQTVEPLAGTTVWLAIFDGSWRCCPNAFDQHGSPIPQVTQSSWLVAIDATALGSGFIYLQDWSGKPVPAQLPSVGSTPASPDVSDNPVLSLRASALPVGDAVTALDVATRFETARATGHWAVAWGLLSDQSQTALGSLTAFEQAEAAYNAKGGTVFSLTAPSHDPALVAAYLGMAQSTIAAEADVTRGFVVAILHPQINGASAGSEGLFVVPLFSGEWRIWIVH